MFAKKNLVAAAALLAVAGAAQADVKLYGYVEMDVGSYELAHTKGTPSRVTKVQSGDMMTSFIGFAGSEDLGGGLKAEFTLESFLAADSGSTLANNHGGFWGRGSNVALSGGFGKVALGQYDNALFTSGYTYNPFGSSMTFSPTMRHLAYIGQTQGGVSFDTGWINSITYETPVMGGFQGIAQYAPKETTVAGTKNSYTLAGSYNAGPFSAMLTYVNAGKAPSTAWTGEEKVWSAGASYDFGVVKAFAQYTDINEKDSVAVVVSNTVTNGAVDANKTKIYQLGVTVPVTDKANIMASYGESKNKVTSTGDKYKDRILSIGYDYALSKRTGVFGAFMNNDATEKDSGQSFAVGVKHSF
ncbi:MAG TPA: porin [Aquabacterium sp.]|uniref:porin n=1 Tax=Aquabacterium sp. TaxID=1872578 RepID=UPI002E379644|nr:porin [Aquabacterium sp.]HEX5357488.1 porin [Aquabacterium sp.]